MPPLTPEAEAFLGGITLLDILAWLAAAASLFAVIKWVLPAVKKILDTIDDLAGEKARPGVPERPGLMARMQKMEEVMETVRHELFPNSGKSMRDQTNRIEEKVNQDNVRLNSHDEAITELTAILKRIEEKS